MHTSQLCMMVPEDSGTLPQQSLPCAFVYLQSIPSPHSHLKHFGEQSRHDGGFFPLHDLEKVFTASVQLLHLVQPVLGGTVLPFIYGIERCSYSTCRGLLAS